MKPAYFPQLDGVRGIAILIVLGGHFLPMLPRHLGDFASLGVILFFALSGFLISGILLDLPHRRGAESWRGLYSFYARRSLRIFPIYYLTICLVAVWSEPVRAHFWRLACYLFYIPWLPGADFSRVGHLWSLSVEEQFYWIWPLLLVFLPRGRLHGVLLAAVSFGFAYKVAVVLALHNFGLAFRLLPGAVDALGLGSLLALYLHDAGLRERCLPALLAASRFVGWPGFVLLAAWRVKENFSIHSSGYLNLALLLFFTALASVSLLHFAVRGGGGPLGSFLSSRPLVWVGKISYGLYVYHLLMPGIVLWAADRLGLSLAMYPRRGALVNLAASFAVAAVSWYALERPILGLKKWFDYRHPAALPQ